MFQIESLSLRRNQLTIIYFLNNIFMKKFSLLLAGFVLFFAPQAQAQDDNIFKHVGFGVGFGLSGITIDATYSNAYVLSPMFTISKGQDVELVETETVKTQKIYHNGHFYIIRNGKTYTIQGTLVK